MRTQQKQEELPPLRELHVFLAAVVFYTRIPCPVPLPHSDALLNKSTRYFPLIGWMVGGLSAGVYLLASFLPIPHSVAVLLAMVSSVWLTGAFHEDGFADVCDGFGGGWTKEQILTIMKDSRLGTYGSIGLLLLLLSKFFLLLEMPRQLIPIALVAGHSLSRFAAASFLLTHNYAREDSLSKAKPVAKRLKISELALAGIFGLLPLLLFQSPAYALLLIPVFAVKWWLGRFFSKWIGGYTGDCLGATQQLSEVVFYLFLYFIPWIFT